jgi:hypothetical protein
MRINILGSRIWAIKMGSRTQNGFFFRKEQLTIFSTFKLFMDSNSVNKAAEVLFSGKQR